MCVCVCVCVCMCVYLLYMYSICKMYKMNVHLLDTSPSYLKSAMQQERTSVYFKFRTWIAD